MLGRFAEWLSSMTGRAGDRSLLYDARRTRYVRFLQAYDGIIYRDNIAGTKVQQTKRLKYNFNAPICNIAAAFLVGEKGVQFEIETGDGIDETRAAAITDQANDIWDRSGSTDDFLAAVLLATIVGETGGIVRVGAGGESYIRFVDPCVMIPQFDQHDDTALTSAIIAYEIIDRNGRPVLYKEHWTESELTQQTGTDPAVVTPYPEYGECPVVWIRNQQIKGRVWGKSDLDNGVAELVAEYDHVAEKISKIIDYYASPTIVLRGIKVTELQKDLRSVICLPPNGDAKFLEWSGALPIADAQMERIMSGICVVSETPAIVLDPGRITNGLGNATGVALDVLYGPLKAKTRRKTTSWGPALRQLMRLALKAEGVDVPVENINIHFNDGAPHDMAAFLDAQLKKKALGASQTVLLTECGYDAKTIATMQKENQTIAEQQAQTTASGLQNAFNRGRVA